MGDIDFEMAYERFHAAVRRQAEWLLGDYHEAEDLTQETFLRILCRWSTLRHAPALALWIRRIGRNAAVDRVRHRSRFRTQSLAAEAAQAPPPAPDEEQLLPALVAAIERLPHLLGTTLLLAAVDGLEPREISALMGTTPGNVKVRLHRARALLHRAWSGTPPRRN
jgi:RNA polymerase sigma-70 factor (ECF subfamily)